MDELSAARWARGATGQCGIATSFLATAALPWDRPAEAGFTRLDALAPHSRVPLNTQLMVDISTRHATTFFPLPQDGIFHPGIISCAQAQFPNAHPHHWWNEIHGRGSVIVLLTPHTLTNLQSPFAHPQSWISDIPLVIKAWDTGTGTQYLE